MKRVRVIVAGRVQGVGFRFFVADGAKIYNLHGFVRNLADGRVEIDAEGERENIHLFLDNCKRGPSFSRIDTFYVKEVPFFGYDAFNIKH